MADSREVRKEADSGQESLFWLKFGVTTGVILVLLAVIWALLTVATLDSAAPRTAAERQLRGLAAAVEAEPDNAAAWAKYIQAQALAGDFAGAKRALERADDALGTRRGQVAIEAARISFLEEDYAKALEDADAALAVVAEETEAETKRLSERGIAMKPDATSEVNARILKAEILTATDDLEGAVALYSEALEINGRMADIFLERGLLYERLGQTERARDDFSSALTYVPDYAPALQALERIGE